MVEPYAEAYDLIHRLETKISQLADSSQRLQEADALERAHDNLVHQVAEWIRTAELRANNL